MNNSIEMKYLVLNFSHDPFLDIVYQCLQQANLQLHS